MARSVSPLPRMPRYAAYLLALLLATAGGTCQPSTTPPSPDRPERIEVRVWRGAFPVGLERHLETTLAAFHAAHDSIRVVTQQHPGHPDAAIRRLQLKIALGEPPDLVWLPPVYTADLASAGVLRSVDHFAARDSSFDPDALHPILWETATYEGTRYTLPIQANTLGIYYNKRLFEEAGLTRLPATWEELADAAKRLTRDRTGNGTPDQYGLLLPMGTREWTVWVWQTFLWQAGGQYIDRAPIPKPAFHHPAGVEALRYWVDLAYEHEAALFSQPNRGWDLQPFVDERVAMQIGGPWAIPELDRIDTLDYGVMPLPRHRQHVTNIGGENLYILKSTPEREQAAWTVARYLVRPEVQRSLALEGKYFPVLRSSTASDWFAEHLAEHSAFRTFFDALDDGRLRPTLPKYYLISQALGRQIRAALQREQSPEAALQAASQEARLILADPAALDRVTRPGSEMSP